jgi:MFS family permease
VTGMGIGGEYTAINSAIDELIPAKHRGRIDILINGTYWAGAAAGALLSVVALHVFSPLLSWRVCFGLGFVLGSAILIVRRHVPESPRWLFIHGREDKAEEVTRDIERQVMESTGATLEEPDDTITIKQRKSIGLWEILVAIVRNYPKRFVLGIALFIGQAFLYNAILFGYATLLSKFFGVSTSNAPYYLVAGVSAAYLTVSEIFPMETRALAIAIFYALGTGLGGIIGPQLFGRLIPTGKTSDIFFALIIGSVLMIVGGLVEIVFGVKAERRSLEGIAKPLTAVESAVKSGVSRAGSKVTPGRHPRVA